MKNLNILSLTFFVLFFLVFTDLSAQKSTGINNSNPSLKAALHIKRDGSSLQGIILPKLAGSDTTSLKSGLTNAEKGLVFYDTTNSVYQYWNGTRWYSFGRTSTSSSSPWTQSSSSIYPTTLTNNVGIGTASPTYPLDIQSSSDALLNITSSADALNTMAGLRLSMFKTYTNTQYYLYAEKNDNVANSGTSDFVLRKDFSTAGGYLKFLRYDGNTNDVIFNDSKTSTGNFGNVIVANGNVGIGTNTPSVSLDLSAKTDAIALPKGVAGVRPTIPATGMLRYNTASNMFEGYTSTGWNDFQTGAYSSPWSQTASTIYPTDLTKKVGIGIATPGYALHVTDNSANPGIFTRQDGTGPAIQGNNYSSGIGVQGGSSGSGYAIYANMVGSGTALYATTSGTGAAGVFMGGNVGIGTTTPTSPLHVNSTTVLGTPLLSLQSGIGTIDFMTSGSDMINIKPISTGGKYMYLTHPSGPIVAFGSNGINGWLGTNSNHSLTVVTNSTARITVLNSGYVGIGITTPTKRLHIVNNTPTADYDAALYTSSSATDGAGFYGAMVYRRNTTNYGIFAHSDAIANTSPLGVSRAADGALVNFMSGGVVEGQISVSGTTITYGAFTGVHYAISDETNFERGLLVTLTGDNQYYHGDKDAEILHGIKLSSKANDSKLIGTYLGLIDPLSKLSLENPHQVMSVGNGEMWVIDNGSDIEPGDYLISSEVIGHGMKESGQFEIANIIARTSESVNWNKEQKNIGGVKHKKIAVFYESFIINNKANRLENELNNLKKEIEIIKAEVEVLFKPYHSANQHKNK